MRSCDYYMMVGVRGYDKMTMQEKRNAINNNLKAFQKSEKYKKYNGFAPIELLKENPFQNPPSYEKLVGDMDGLYSRRINLKHRLVYQVYEEEKTVKIVSAWSHYEKI